MVNFLPKTGDPKTDLALRHLWEQIQGIKTGESGTGARPKDPRPTVGVVPSSAVGGFSGSVSTGGGGPATGPSTSAYDYHLTDYNNPHKTTYTQVGAPPTGRKINTTAPLLGGGDLSADRTLSVSNATTLAVGVIQLAGDLTGTATSPALANIITAAGPIGDSTHVSQITYDAKGRLTAVSSVAIAYPGGMTGFANPSASIGLTSVNGVATTAMRSDAAQALDISISPTWTGTHVFNITPTVGTKTNGDNSTKASSTAYVDGIGTAMGDMLYWSASGTRAKLAGPTSATKQFLTSTGTGAAANAPAWGAIASADLPTITLTGDVTGAASGGSIASTLNNIPSATPMAGSILATAIAAPATPAAGKASVYVDSTSKNLAVKNDAGTVNHGIQSRTATTSNWVTAINDDGTTAIAQPAFSDLSGSASSTQVPWATPGAIGSTTPSTGAFTTISVTSSTASTSSTTGALTVSGGLGVAGAIFTADAISSSLTVTSTSGTFVSMKGTPTINPSGASSAQVVGYQSVPTIPSSCAQNMTAVGVGGMCGVSAQITHAGTGLLTRGVGVNSTLNTGSGVNSVSDYICFRAIVNNSGTGTLGAAYGYRVETFTNTGGGAVTVLYAIKVENQTAGATNYALYTGTGLIRIGDTTDSTSSSSGAIQCLGGAGFAKSIYSAAAILSSGATSGIGYATGAGGTVTQTTSKSTGVTLNKACGEITLNGASLAASTVVSFVLTDSAIAAGDTIILNHVSVGTFGGYTINGRCAAGSATIDVRNVTAGSLSEAIVIRFAIIKAVTA